MINLPFIVIDQNALSRDAILQPAIAEARAYNLKLLLTDAALIELVKNANWEESIRAGLARLALVAELVSIARPVPELVRLEASSGSPGYDRLEAIEWRTSIRALLGELRSADGVSLEYMRRNITTTKANVLPQYLDGPSNKAKIAAYVELFKKEFDSDDRKKLASPAYRCEQLAKSVWTDFFIRMLTDMGFANPSAIARGNSIQVQTVFAELLIAMRWYRDGGIENAKEEKLTNDLMDAEYSVLACFCHGFASEDGRSREVWDDLRTIAKLRAAAA
jgi:hypothetical protein